MAMTHDVPNFSCGGSTVWRCQAKSLDGNITKHHADGRRCTTTTLHNTRLASPLADDAATHRQRDPLLFAMATAPWPARDPQTR